MEEVVGKEIEESVRICHLGFIIEEVEGKEIDIPLLKGGSLIYIHF